MFCSRSITLCYLLFSFMLNLATCNDICFSTETYVANSPYSSNLNNLLSLLSTKVPSSGFGFGSVGQCERINGLALCHGDVSSENCKTCVIEASKELLIRCPNKKGAIIWSANCLLKYSNEDFFGQIDNQSKFYLYSGDIAENPMKFNGQVKELISNLSSQAYVNSKFYAIGEMALGASEKLYGLAQCTRDLSYLDCKQCLEQSISEIPSCCNGKRGGRILGGSCILRYEVYPFVNA